MNHSDVEKFIQAVSNGISGVIAISVVDLESGMSLGSLSNSNDFDPEVAGAYNSEVVKQKQAAMKALGIGNQDIEDILFTLANQIHIIRMASDKKHFVYVVTKKDANLAITRSVIRQNCP